MYKGKMCDDNMLSGSACLQYAIKFHGQPCKVVWQEMEHANSADNS